MTDEDEEMLQPPRSEDIYVYETKKLIEIYDQPEVEQEDSIVNAVKAKEIDAFMNEIFPKRKKD
jgi:hypothetical protein